MTEVSLEKLVPEKDFAALLGVRAQPFLGLSRLLVGTGEASWTKRDYFQLHTEADELESFLDDYGARYNRTYNYLTELTASIRGFALTGLTLEHLARRLEGYGVLPELEGVGRAEARTDLERGRTFVRHSLTVLLEAIAREARERGLPALERDRPPASQDVVQRFRLPRNVGQEELENEEQRIAEVASKYLQAANMLRDAGIRRLRTESEREAFLADRCSEEQARVYEATVHNLQSAYDTHIKNTLLEARDDRLARLRGFISCSLHLLEAVTQLTHFVERHESGMRSEAAERRLSELVDRSEVVDVTLNALLYWAHRFMERGRTTADDLLPSYMNVQELEVELDGGITLHARPASLIVAIVNHHGTPVEMTVAGSTCHAGSILELMIAVGSHPDERRYTFRGDEHPLRDIQRLFEAGLGEGGLDRLPAELSYLRGD